MTLSVSLPCTSPARRSVDGIAALIEQTVFAQQTPFLAEVFSPLLPDDCPWQHLSDFDRATAKREAPRFQTVTVRLAEFRHELTATAGVLAPWLDASDEEVREVALRYAKLRLPGQQKWAWSQRRLGASIPGKTPESRWARINDARFWRRAIRVRLLREREHFFLRLKLIGRGRETYVSDRQLQTRSRQLRQQAQWMKETVLVPRFLMPGEASKGLLTLAQVASTPKMRFAKLYAFTKAMDEIAQAEGLAAGMLTLTLEPEWHPNPSHGAGSWNGSSPREAHRSMTQRWQSILRDLDHAGVGVSGLRVVEPHKDACPHWHVWLLYKPAAEATILSSVMRYFPNKLKIRAPSRRGDKTHAADRMYDTRSDLCAGKGRPLTKPKEGSQVELSRIDRSISSGASYAMKYLLKSVDAGDQLNTEAGLFADTVTTKEETKRKEAHAATAQRVDAYRALWGINAAQLFGVAKCLSAWDELRRLTKPPVDSRLQKLWALARGTDQPGRIAKNAGIQGQPKAFIEALGGLAACGKPPKDEVRQSIGRLTEAKTNGYGEEIQRAKGVTLVERRRQKVRKGQIDLDTGEIYARSGWHSVKTIVASVITRVGEWVMASAPKTSRTPNEAWLAEQRQALRRAFELQSGATRLPWDAFRKQWALNQPALTPVPMLAEAHAGAVSQAQARAMARAGASDPVWLGKQAVGQFWSAMWQAWETLCPEERSAAFAAEAEPVKPQSWAELLKSWGVAPLQPATA